MHAGIIHRRRDGTWMWGDTDITRPEQVPRGMALNNQAFYFTSSISNSDWLEILSPEDHIFGAAPGTVTGIRIQTTDGNRIGHYKLFNPSIWSISDRDKKVPSLLDLALLQKYAEFSRAGVPSINSSIASTSIACYMRIYDGRDVNGIHYPRLTQLPPRWRSIAHASLHGGPIACLRGGSPDAVEIDLKAAYLDALSKPMPVVTGGVEDNNNPSGYVTFPGLQWDEIRYFNGFVEATVRVSDALRIGLPPLPINTPTGIKYPVGVFRGAWCIHLLREAEEACEVDVMHTHNYCIARRMDPYFAALSQDFSVMPKKISKQLYTRFWGKFAFKGGYSGVKSETPVDDAIPKNHFWWSDTRITQIDTGAQPTYRPDIAAFVASYNHSAMTKAIRLLKPESLIAVHVDAIWTDDIEGAKRVVDSIKGSTIVPAGSWKMKRRGKLRFWGCGVYNHDGKLGYSGYDRYIYGRPTADRIARWIRSSADRGHLRHNRLWNGEDCTVSQSATSSAPTLNQKNPATVLDGISMNSPSWTTTGWVRDQE